MKCQICNYENDDLKAFATHLQIKHKIKSEEYTIKFLYNDKKPHCLICENQTRYVSFQYKQYCKDHSNIAESKAGQIGGKKKKTWNKGKTKFELTKLQHFSEIYSNEGNPFFGKKHSDKSIQKMRENSKLSQINFEKRIKKRNKEFIVLTQYNQYTSRQEQYLEVQCLKCKNISNKTLQAFERGSLCKYCFRSGSISQQEIEISDFLSSLNIFYTKNERNIIAPQELDFLIPNSNFAIEFNGLYWHSDKFRSKNYHLIKTKKCLEKNIKLFHIFSDEWENKKEIVKSMISSRLGLSSKKISARKCQIKVITNQESKEFFNKTHISGYTNSIITFGLYFENELVSAISLRKPFITKYKNIIEISRFSSKLYTNIIGGFSKLMKFVFYWVLEQKYNGILTYADRRFSSGNVYKQFGFQELGETEIDYWYSDGKQRYNRFKFRAQNNNQLSEKQVANMNKVFKIYGCGSFMFFYDLKNTQNG